MKLYHGTSAAVALKSLTMGLHPRSITGKSNWQKAASHPNCVYLTDCYAPYYAFSASDEEDWGLVELETDLLEQSELWPDEDFLEQSTRGQAHFGAPLNGIVERTAYFRQRLWKYSQWWKDSLKHLGTCCYRGHIPASAITRISLFDPASNLLMGVTSADPFITLQNHRLFADKYRLVTAWLMGAEVSVDEFIKHMHAFGMGERVMKAFGEEEYRKQVEYLRQELLKTGGRKVIQNNLQAVNLPCAVAGQGGSERTVLPQ